MHILSPSSPTEDFVAKPALNLFARALCGVLAFALVATLSSPAQAGVIEFTNGDDLTISLVTFGPGDEVNTFFGHNGLIVEDAARGYRILYHYGLFSFGPDMLARYLMGHLVFSTGRMLPEPEIERYRLVGRDVRIAELSLTAPQRLAVARRLEHDVQPEHRDYVYHHYFTNCSTRLRDLLDDVLGGQLHRALSGPAEFSFREQTRRYAGVNTVVDLVLLLWMNDDMEQPIERWNEAFLPDVLEAQLMEIQIEGEDGSKRPLVSRRSIVFDAGREPIPAAPTTIFPYVLILSLAAGAGAVALTRWAASGGWQRGPTRLLGAYHSLAGLVLGLPGTLLFFMATFTEHLVTHRNENLWFCNPLTLLVLPLGVAIALGSVRARRLAGSIWIALAVGGVVALALKVLPSFDQDNTIALALIVPVNLGFALAAYLGRAAKPRSE